MRYFADIDTNKKCYCVKEVNDNYINDENSIEIDFKDESLLNRIHNVGKDFYSLTQIVADKLQIKSDGVEISTITSDFLDYYTINGQGNYMSNPLQFCSNVSGSYEIKAHSALHGENSIIIEVV